MNNNYKLIVKGQKLDADGIQSKVSEDYLVRAVNIVDAVTIATENLLEKTKGDSLNEYSDFEVDSVVKTKYTSVLWDPELVLSCNDLEKDWRSYEVCIQAYYEDGNKKSGMKNTKHKFMVFAEDLNQAEAYAIEYMDKSDALKHEVFSASERKFLSYLTELEYLESPLAEKDE